MKLIDLQSSILFLRLRYIFVCVVMVMSVVGHAASLSPISRTGRLFDDRIAVAGDYTGFCQDKDGYIWIGTNKGLLRFDGNTYDIYRHEDSDSTSVSDNRILGLLNDSKGRVWIATANGLNLYVANEDNFRVIPISGKSFHGYIIGLTEQTDGTVTFVISGVGVYVVDEESGDPVGVQYFGGDMEKDVNSIVCGPNGRLYMGSRDGRFYMMAPNGKITPMRIAEGVYVVSISVENDGNVLIATPADLYRYYAGEGIVRRLAIDGSISIMNLSNSTGGKVYIATAGHGLWQIEVGADRAVKCTDIYCPFMDLSTAKIGAVYFSPKGNLWLGCDFKGIVIVPGRTIPFRYRRITDYCHDFGGGISAMGIWNGNVIVCLDKGRVIMLDQNGDVMLRAVIPEGENLTHIEVLDGDKALISVTNSGLWLLDLHTGKVSKLLDIPGKYLQLVTAPGKLGELFIGVHGIGLMHFDMASGNREWIPFDADTSFSNPYITCLNHTSDDKIWIGLFGGLACYDLKSRRMLDIDQTPFLKGATFAISPCLTDSSVWVGTSYGLLHFDPAKGLIGKYTTADGLSDNDIRSITRDHHGGKWIATMRGLSYIPTDNDTILSYYGGNGLVENSFKQIRFSRNTRRIYLGSDLGITSFLPDSLPSPGFGSEVKVSAVFLNGRRIAPYSTQKDYEVVRPSDGNPVTLKLTYKDNSLTFRLSTMDFRDASNVRYMWRLGKKSDWIMGAPGVNSISLPHLDPGTYDLEIRALENNVTSPTKLIRIVIATPWYMSWWAIMIYTLVFLTIIVLCFLVWKKKRDERVNEDKIKFFMDISHDLRSPMTLIVSPLENMLKEQTDPATKGQLQLMHRNVQRVMSLINQLLDIRKLDKGKMPLTCRKTDIREFVNELVDLFKQQAADKRQTITFECECDPGAIWLDRDNFDKILVNLISNALKYTPEDGTVTVRLDLTDDDRLGHCVRVNVIDTGIGLDNVAQGQLFERFYRASDERSSATIGFGIGLDLCRRLVELHHGKITGENRHDGVKGSVFSVIIPISEDKYGEDELLAGDSETGYGGKHLLMVAESPAGDLPSKPKPLTAGNKVLVVDDDSDLRNYIKEQLGKYYKVKTASDGTEALKLVADWKPDIIVSDVVMPNTDGLTLLRRLKSNAETNHIPVVLLSSKISLSDRMAGWEKGADGYLGKPFNTDELISLVDTLIENRLRLKGKFSGAQDTEGKIDAPEVKSNHEALMDRIIKVINDHIEEPELNVEKLSMAVGVSRAQLHRKMKELIGMTPSDYIRNIRLHRACDLLRQSDIEVTQVAYKIGFTSQPHFSAHFKKYTGYTPSEFRAKCQEGAEPEISA